jgi:hypothetical protein
MSPTWYRPINVRVPTGVPRPPMAQPTFVSAKVEKQIGITVPGAATARTCVCGRSMARRLAIRNPISPCDARCARKTRTSLCSNSLRFLARVAALLGRAKGGLVGHPGRLHFNPAPFEYCRPVQQVSLRCTRNRGRYDRCDQRKCRLWPRGLPGLGWPRHGDPSPSPAPP